MLSANDLIRIIKEAAVEAVRENDPADVHYGTIEEADPETFFYSPKTERAKLFLNSIQNH